jgi:putative transposase
MGTTLTNIVIHVTFSTKFAWQKGYGAFSVSESLVPTVRKYLRNQERYHRNLSFKEEFIRLLELHVIK